MSILPKKSRSVRKCVKPVPLASRDLENLKASGLSQKTIRDNGIHTKDDAMVFPFRNLQGSVNGYAVTRPHKPRLRDGKLVKYENPPGEPTRAYFPKGSVASLCKGSDDILITEGPKKALALDQAGYTAIGLVGVWNWKIKKTEELHDDLSEIDWTGRTVNICFDYDKKEETRLTVDKAKSRLATALYKAGAEKVCDVVLPPGDGGEKQGVDDFIVANGEEAIEELPIKVIKIIPVAPAGGGNKVIKIIPPVLSGAAYQGRIGDFIESISPHTEATDAGMLAHILPAVGTLIGSGPCLFAGSPQPPRLNVAVVGPTSTGRKGTAAAPVDMLLKMVDEEFYNTQRVSGLSSGEGLIAKVADKWETDGDGNKERIPTEKRVYVMEPEFSRVLANCRREGNILSQIMREAFDSGNLSTLTVNPREAKGAHISIVGHVTPEEITERLSHIDMANGFANRFLWFAVVSDKIFPHPTPFPGEAFVPLVKRLRTLLDLGSENKAQQITLNEKAAELWTEKYPELRQDRPGLAGAMVARGSAMVLRLSLIYCLLDEWKSTTRSPSIGVSHLQAGLAVWDYSCQSVYRLFGPTADNFLSAKILSLLGDGAMSKTALNRHLSSKQKESVPNTLAELVEAGQICEVKTKKRGAGRPTMTWKLA